MPVGRYFAVTGSVLLALLFLIDWYLPSAGTAPAVAVFDHSVIRIQSRQRWPSPVVFDTTQPTIVPPAPVSMAAAPAPPANPPREALAYAPQPNRVSAVAAPPRHRARRTKIARAPTIGVASSEPGFREVFSRDFFQPSW